MCLHAQCQCSVTSTTPAKCPHTCYKPPLSNPIKIRCVFLSRCYSRTNRRTGMARQKVHNESIANQTIWYICCSLYRRHNSSSSAVPPPPPPPTTTTTTTTTPPPSCGERIPLCSITTQFNLIRRSRATLTQNITSVITFCMYVNTDTRRAYLHFIHAFGNGRRNYAPEPIAKRTKRHRHHVDVVQSRDAIMLSCSLVASNAETYTSLIRSIYSKERQKLAVKL